MTFDYWSAKIWLGKTPSSVNTTNPDYYATFPLVASGDYWAVSIGGVYWGSNMSLPTNVQAASGTGILDTGHDAICLPKTMEASFNKTFAENCTYIGGEYVNCKNVPSLAINIGQYAFYMDNYLSTNGNTLKISLKDECVTGTPGSYVLGMPWFKQFVTVFDNKNTQLGIYTTGHRVPYGGAAGKMMIVIGIIVAVIVLIGLGLGIYCWMKRRGSEEGLTEGLNK